MLTFYTSCLVPSHHIIQMLAKSFAKAGVAATNQASIINNKSNAPLAPAAAAPSSTSNDELEQDISLRYKSIHEALRIVLKLVPAGLSELFPALREAFPHRRIDGPGSIVHYTKQLLLIADYLPSLSEKILSLIVERCLEIDVEIKIEDSGEARVSVEDHEGALVLSEHIYHDPDGQHHTTTNVEDGEEAEGPVSNEIRTI